MKRLLLVAASCLLVAGCAYRPSDVQLVKIVDTPASVKACQKVGEVSGPFETTPGTLWGSTVPMREKVLELGGNILLLEPQGKGWGVVRASAYHCTDSTNDGW